MKKGRRAKIRMFSDFDDRYYRNYDRCLMSNKKILTKVLSTIAGAIIGFVIGANLIQNDSTNTNN